jgi:erythromycin esterase
VGISFARQSSNDPPAVLCDDWEVAVERMRVPPGRRESWEDLLHRAGAEDRLLLLDEAREDEAFLEERGHRASGVVYHSAYEGYGNYVPTVLPLRHDAFLFLRETHALCPLHDVKAREDAQVPETYPSGV